MHGETRAQVETPTCHVFPPMHLVGVCIHMYVAGLLKEGLHLDAVPDLPANELIQPLLLPQTGERLHILYVEVEEDAESTNAGSDKERSCFYVLVL